MMQVSDEIGLSHAEAHKAMGRAAQAQLLAAAPDAPVKRRGRPSRRVLVNRPALIEFVKFGVRYVFIPDRGRVVRGMPTAHAVAPLRDHVRTEGLAPVWPDPRGTVRGESFSPIYKSAVHAARMDVKLYELLALVDAIRSAGARERAIAADLFADLVSLRG